MDDRFEYIGNDTVLFTPRNEREREMAELLVSLSEEQLDLLNQLIEYMNKKRE